MQQVYTWGHRLVTPKRLVIARNLKKSGNTTLKFHRKERLHVIAIAAGMVHSMALTDDGALFYWISSDPDLRCQQVSFNPCTEFFTCLKVKHVSNFQCFTFLPVAVFSLWTKYSKYFCREVLDCCCHSYR